jgi:hypothetical protein
VTDNSTLFTFEMAVDRDFNEELGKSLGQAFKAAGALPVFAPSAPYLIAAGVAIPLAAKAANLLARPRTFFDVTLNVDLAQPGHKVVNADAHLIFPDKFKDEFNGLKVDKSEFIVRKADGSPYDGPAGYMLVSLDGTPQPKYEKWAAHAASAALTEQFFGGGGALTKAIELASEGLGLYNDVVNQKAALEVKKRMAVTKNPAEKAKLKALFDGHKAKIQNEEIRGSVK